eukprot:TRINITY_DN8495_c3_g1_i1.p1 TRINITY_DN8495_c3_g1~~TRINITY_DN8495_c3_g1_i1.p1  ORF type:complete len:206 (+),score=57.53 TRINITY_DN8495_c3_g1_i1:127-744(+)
MINVAAAAALLVAASLTGFGNKTCKSACKADEECNSGGDYCLLCINKTCGSGCAQKCDNSTQCTSPGCPLCNEHGQCSRRPNSTCLGVCLTNEDCTGPCKLCFAKSPQPGKCGSGCSAQCANSSQCLDKQCPNCIDGRCAKVPTPPGPTPPGPTPSPAPTPKPIPLCGYVCAADSNCDSGAATCLKCTPDKPGVSCTAGDNCRCK